MVMVDGATYGQAALFRERAPACAGTLVAECADRVRSKCAIACGLGHNPIQTCRAIAWHPSFPSFLIYRSEEIAFHP
jgi:hypothetical protein